MGLAQSFEVDEARLHKDRLERARTTMRKHSLAAMLLIDPVNVRYVSAPGMCPVYAMHGAIRWVLVPVDSTPILWEVSYYDRLQAVPDYWGGEIRPSAPFTFFGSGEKTRDDAKAFATEVADALRERELLSEPLGVDKIETVGFLALCDAGITVADAQPVVEEARSLKNEQELEILRQNARTTGRALEKMISTMRPGMTEHQIWATFVGDVFGRGAEWCETRFLSSGPRTNPWMREATHRVVEDGEFVAIDTDLVGEYGYLTDLSRTYVIGDGPATNEQRRLFAAAYEYVYSAIPEIRPGASFRELGEKLGPRFPEEFWPLRYSAIAHGAGMIDEYPAIEFDSHHGGQVEAGMCLSVEAYVGVVGGKEGVKFEEMIIVNADANEVISQCAPYDDRLMP